MTMRRALIPPRPTALALLLLAGLAQADPCRVSLGSGGVLGLWSVWETAANEYELVATLEPGDTPAAIRLFNVEIHWDAAVLTPAGDPLPGTLFDGVPETWFGHYDQGAMRTVTQTALGEGAGATPGVPVVLFRQRFHAVAPSAVPTPLALGSVTLRGPDNQAVPVAAGPAVPLTVDTTPPQGYTFTLEALVPAGNPTWTAQTLVACALTPGDGSLAGWLLSESAGLPANPAPGWNAPPTPISAILSSGDGLKTVHAYVRDVHGNRADLADAITLDTQAPLYHVTQLTAKPRHEGCLVTWNNPVAPDFHKVRLYRHGWCDDGLSRYPEYDDVAPMSPYPESEDAALAAGFQLVYEGSGQSWLDSRVPRDVLRYVAFCVDFAGHPGPGNASARDRSTNYLLGDVRTPWDGTVYVQDLVRLSAGYRLAEGEPGWNAHLDYGPTDDVRRDGIPLTDSVVDFEDLMVFAMNYGLYGPLAAGAGDPAASPRERLVLDRDGGLRARLDGEWQRLRLVLEWDGQAVPAAEAAGKAAWLQASPGRLVLDRALQAGEDPRAPLVRLDFGPAGPPADLRVTRLDIQ